MLHAIPAQAMACGIEQSAIDASRVRLFLSGDVMTGRGIDQVLPHPCDPLIHEPYVRDAREYVALAEAVNGPIPRVVEFPYIWGDALEELEDMAPDLRVINLETSVTSSDDYWPGKGINYRMHPKNLPCISAAGINCCILANNHVLDWGYGGLGETLEGLKRLGIEAAGAGNDLQEAQAPAIMELPGGGRVLVFAFGHSSSGVPFEWAAGSKRAGIHLLEGLSSKEIRRIGQKVAGLKRELDIVVASIHWGGNWGYRIEPEQLTFAHRLIDEAGVDLVHGHSSHHPKGIEIYQGKLILYGCGDLLNDYEGISGYESFRDDLGLMYFPNLELATGRVAGLTLVPTQIRNFRLNRVSGRDAQWLKAMLNREGSRFGTRVELNEENRLTLA